MAEVKVLIKGYAREGDDGEEATCTTTLIRENNLNIIVDPGMNRKLLLEGLKKENLEPKDISYVILTHTHLDHCLLTGIFEKATILDDSSLYSFDGKIREHEGKVPDVHKSKNTYAKKLPNMQQQPIKIVQEISVPSVPIEQEAV